MPTIITDGAASAQGYGFAARSVAANYIEDVFSTYLYAGNGSTQTITNGIDLSGKGGLVWTKVRGLAQSHILLDTVRGGSNYLISNNTGGSGSMAPYGLTFSSTGYTVSDINGGYYINEGGQNEVSWTFREQPKFFDIVTYTGTGTNQTIAHNLGSVPGCIMVKRTDTTAAWAVYHRSLANTQYMVLNTTATAATGATYWNSTTPTSSVFSLGTNSAVNASGGTYVAYLFAHDAGGFGATGSDNVISCGSFTTDGSGNATVNLGYEPQWVILKNATTASNNEWRMVDNMRGFPVDGASSSVLAANSSAAEFTSGTINVLNTGIQIDGLANSATFIYIAIRRGPMKTPTLGTSVFSPKAQTATAGTSIDVGFPVDASICTYRTAYNANYMGVTQDRLRGYANANTSGTYPMLMTWATDSETAFGPGNPVIYGINNAQTTISFGTNAATGSTIVWNFRRAPGFFDVVCYTATGVARTINHNLGVAPELMIVKNRSAGRPWAVYSSSLLNTEFLDLSTTAAKSSVSGSTYWNSTNPTASVFSVGTNAAVNDSISSNYVAYLFATVAGVSKVGSYTGSGTTKQINCGFTGGARFVLIKRTDSTGDWYVWDSARGIVAGNDSYLLLNSTAAEVTNTDYVDTYSAGFEISSTAPAAINANGGSFIFFAVA